MGAYGGGQYELGPGRGQIQYLAGVFHPDAPNDIAPAGYDDLEQDNRELQARCASMSADGALSATLFVGFPHADIHNAGLSVVVVTDGDKALALFRSNRFTGLLLALGFAAVGLSSAA